MKYYLDTEFIESFHKPLFGKRRHFIDLISIGIVCEDGREYYAISNEFDIHDADQWVQDNVIAKLPDAYFDGHNASRVVRRKSNAQIAAEIKMFFGYTTYNLKSNFSTSDSDIEVYAYYADYDWVLFCSLFGRMIDLPKGMPMYCKDLKQMMDEKANEIYPNSIPMGEKLEKLKKIKGFPKQDNEHEAIDDAKWNKKLHEFLQSLKK